jgi:hypothetical protein
MGNNDTAIAVGNPGPNAFQMATENTGALAGGGSSSTAIALGNGTIASAAPGPLSMGRNKAFALGDGSFAEAPIFFPGETAGSGNTAIVVGTNSTATTGGRTLLPPPIPGNSNTAFVFGNNSTATVGFGNHLRAGVIGNGLNATAPPSVIVVKP